MILVGLLVASIGLDIETRGAERSELSALTNQLGRAIEEAAGQPVVVEADPGPSCSGPTRAACLTDRRRRFYHSDWVTLLVIVGPTRTRVVAERIGASANVIEAELELPRGEPAEQASLGGWARRLFPFDLPSPISDPSSDLSAPSPSIEGSPAPILPIVGVALGVAAIVAAVVLENNRAGVEGELMSPHPLDADDALLSSRARYGTAARICAGSGAVLLGASVVLLILD